jgi:hypothetical protein
MQPNAVTAECNARGQEAATVSIAALHLCLSYEQTESYRIAWLADHPGVSVRRRTARPSRVP